MPKNLGQKQDQIFATGKIGLSVLYLGTAIMGCVVWQITNDFYLGLFTMVGVLLIVMGFVVMISVSIMNHLRK